MLLNTISINLKRSTLIALGVFMITVSTGILQTKPASALSGSAFNPGFIISDAEFYNPYTMNSSTVQNWLNAQVPTCDVNGTQASPHWFGAQNRYYTRAEWGNQTGNPPPFTCLKNYQAATGNEAADAYCQNIPAGTRTAAQMIADIAVSCGINPQVLLVLLQKEQGLVTDDWPWQYQYTSATGYACPDTASCDTRYSGLFNQLYMAAWQYQYYKANPTKYNYRAERTQTIQYNPQSSCGGSSVYIQNQATAALYIYTPYQPNTAALSNLYGTGDSCSSYGNRNFWRIFSGWFGDPTAGCTSSNTEVIRLYDPKTYQHYFTTDYCEANTLSHGYGYSLEGTVFNSVDSSVPGAVAIYRLYNTQTGIHTFVTTQADIDAATNGAGYHLEGPAFYVAPSTSAGSFPVYRLYNPKTFIHLFVTTQTDINAATNGAGYHLEGIAFYATP